jgi:hypothetical protein
MARFCQLHPAGRAPQQGNLIMLLQRLDVTGHRRLADEQACGGAGKTAFTGYRVESTQLEQVHGHRPG